MSRNIVIKKETEKEILEVFQDESPESPREWDNLGIIVAWHKRYNLGDTKDFKEPQDFEEYLKSIHDKAIVLNVYMYEHGSIGLSVSNGSYPYNCPWDSGQLGYIYATYESIKKNFNKKRLSKKTLKRARDCLISEIDIYSKYINGEVYGYVLSEKHTCNLGQVHEEFIDSWWGFYDIEDIYDSIDKKWKDIKEVN